MSEEIEEKNVELEAEEVNTFAKVGEVFEDGVTLIFDAQQEEGASEKHYRCNAGIKIASGDRVKLLKDSGTYVVEYVVGAPNSDLEIPSGGSSGQVLMKTGSANTAYGWRTFTVEGRLPTGGTAGQYLVKNSSTNYDAKWQTLSVDGTIPTGGTAGQYLVKNSAANYDAKWQTFSAKIDSLYVSTTNNVTLDASRHLVPHASSSTYPYSLGSSTYPWYNLYMGSGTIQLGNSGTGTYSTHIGFYGATPIVQQQLITTSNNQGYTSATASNYLYILNNIAGILKKLGLLRT